MNAPIFNALTGGISPYRFVAFRMGMGHCLQLWFDLSDGAAEDALHDILPFRQFTDIRKYVPDRTTIINFRHFLEKYHAVEQVLTRINDKLKKVGLMLRHGVIIDATIISWRFSLLMPGIVELKSGSHC